MSTPSIRLAAFALTAAVALTGATATAAAYAEPVPPPVSTQTDPGQTDPGQTDPAPTDPGQTDPGKPDPGQADPAPTTPVPTKPAPTDPPSTKPTPTKPAPAKISGKVTVPTSRTGQVTLSYRGLKPETMGTLSVAAKGARKAEVVYKVRANADGTLTVSLPPLQGHRGWKVGTTYQFVLTTMGGDSYTLYLDADDIGPGGTQVKPDRVVPKELPRTGW